MNQLRHSAAVVGAALAGVVATLALGPGSSATAAGQVGSNGIKNDAVLSRHIKNGTIHAGDLAKSSVGSGIVKDDSLSGTDIVESTLGQVPSALTATSATTATSAADANTVGGRAAGSFASSVAYVKESATAAGTQKGDGTFVLAQGCNSGDLMLSGGPANVAATSDMIESFPSPGSTTSWSVRLDKNGVGDDFSVVVLCLDQTP